MIFAVVFADGRRSNRTLGPFVIFFQIDFQINIRPDLPNIHQIFSSFDFFVCFPVCVDSNHAQKALMKLKLSAIRQLNHEQFLEILGVKPSQKRCVNKLISFL